MRKGLPHSEGCSQAPSWLAAWLGGDPRPSARTLPEGGAVKFACLDGEKVIKGSRSPWRLAQFGKGECSGPHCGCPISGGTSGILRKLLASNSAFAAIRPCGQSEMNAGDRNLDSEAAPTIRSGAPVALVLEGPEHRALLLPRVVPCGRCELTTPKGRRDEGGEVLLGGSLVVPN